MFRSLLAVASNTFTETLRQPIYTVIIGVGLIFMIFLPFLSMFTMDDDNQLLKDVGLSTLLVSGLFMAVFSAATVITDEIDHRTVLTVLSKTVSRTIFIIGKFAGIAAAVILAQYFLGLVLLMIVRNGAPQTASDENDPVVYILGTTFLAITLTIGVFGNYFYRWRFSTVFITLGTILATLLMTILFFIDHNWRYNPEGNNLALDLLGHMSLTVMAVLILTALAIAIATRFGLLVTLGTCLTLFVLGVMVQYWIGPYVHESTGIVKYLSWAILAIIPSMNFFVASNAIYSDTVVPSTYISQVGVYSFYYIMAVLLLAISLFRHRDIG